MNELGHVTLSRIASYLRMPRVFMRKPCPQLVCIHHPMHALSQPQVRRCNVGIELGISCALPYNLHPSCMHCSSCLSCSAIALTSYSAPATARVAATRARFSFSCGDHLQRLNSAAVSDTVQLHPITFEQHWTLATQ